MRGTLAWIVTSQEESDVGTNEPDELVTPVAKPGDRDDSRPSTSAVSATTVGAVVQAATVHGGVHIHPPQPVAARQLPAAPRLFAGRVVELTELDNALANALDNTPGHNAMSARGVGSAMIAAICGAGGIGKTWLALSWAYRNLDRFPDGHLFVDLRGFSSTASPTDPADALRGFLHALGIQHDRQPSGLDALAAMYRSLVADKRMLVVLDNAASVEQVVPLLPGGTSCTVLVTSRNRLRGLVAHHGAHPLVLGVLTDAEARACVETALGSDSVTANESSVAELITLCGGFPLALGLIAARARTQPHVPLGAIATELREVGLDALDSDDPAASFPTVLSWSLRHLTQEQNRAFALLGIAPGPHTRLPAAASLIGVPARETRTTLRTLVDACLLEDISGGRYAMHDLIRAYAVDLANQLPHDVQLAALRRVVDFYLHTAHGADHQLFPFRSNPIPLASPAPGVQAHPLPDAPAVMAWFDTEHANLLSAQHTAITHGWHSTVWQLAWSTTFYHYWTSDRQGFLAVWRAAVDAAAHLSDPAAITLAHLNLGRAYINLGRLDEAAGHLDQALALAKHHRDLDLQALIHQALRWAWRERGDQRRALDHALQALHLFRAVGRQDGEAGALATAGWCFVCLGDYEAARKHSDAALALYQSLHALDSGAVALDCLGYIDHHTGHHQQAIRHYSQALALHRDAGHSLSAVITLDRLGHPHAALGQQDQARAVWQEALRLYREHGRDEEAARVQRQLDDLGTSSTETPGRS